MKVTVLYFDGCPHFEPAMALVRDVVSDLGVDAEVMAVQIENNQDACRHRFLGSPTVQVDGEDVEPTARHRTDYAMSCRRYGTSGVPGRELVENALRKKRKA